jgi:hypothetical protein
MNTSYTDRIFLIIFSIVLIFISRDIYMINTGDFSRVTSTLIEEVPSWSSDLTLNYKLQSPLSWLSHYKYKSSYSFIVYFYSLFLSIFTNYFDMRLFSAIQKLLYMFLLFVWFKAISKLEGNHKYIIFMISMLPLISSSNIAAFSSFYQEAICLIFIPALLVSITKNSGKYYLLYTASLIAISCSKSQYFYLPIIGFAYFLIFNRERLKIKFALTLAALFMSIICMSSSGYDVKCNRYHSLYFGVYLYESRNNIKLPRSAIVECIGHDAWGNKFDIEKGAVATNIGSSCMDKAGVRSFSRTLTELVKHPSIIFKLPFDEGVREQLTENYFHVGKDGKMIVNNVGFLSKITSVKPELCTEMTPKRVLSNRRIN